MNRVLDKIAKFRERDFDDIPASHVRTLICDEIETDAILDEKERASKELGSEKTPRKVKGVECVASRAHNTPIAEMTWVREAFAIAKKHSVDNNYREMWKSRKNAVLWSLRHR